jgi:tRNA(Ile)-lysidine synthase
MSNWQKIIKKVSAFCTEFELLNTEDRLLIAISGGPDSVLLTEALAELAPKMNLHCHLAHVNYSLRGRESDEDQEFVEKLAAEKKWPLDIAQPNSNELRGEKGNFQDWARQYRYQFFAELCNKYSLNKIVVGHHLNDQIETFFLRLLRGSGLTGLSAMRPYGTLHNKCLIRPFLCLSRNEIAEALHEKGLSYRHDITNDSSHYRRNRLRHDILPILSQIQPGYERALGDSLLLMQAEDQLLNDMAQQSLTEMRLDDGEGLVLSRNAVESLPKSLRLRILRRMIGELTGGPQSITFHHVSKMEYLLAQGPQKASYDLPGGLQYEQDQKKISVFRKK